jgi:hypothetical protein
MKVNLSQRSKKKIKKVLRDVFDGWYYSLNKCGDTETEMIKVHAVEYVVDKIVDDACIDFKSIYINKRDV